MRTPSHKLTADFFFGPGNDMKCIPKESFVCPIRLDYVPKHCKENKLVPFKAGRDTFCYTRYGILPIPTEHVKVVE